MRKLLAALLLIVIMIFSSTYAATTFGIDLAGLSFDELLALRDQIMNELVTRAEWDNVLIPAGTYEIGVDIPEGKWTISAEPNGYFIVKIGNGINETYTDFSGDLIDYKLLTGKNSVFYDSSSTTSVTWNFSKGHFFISDGPTIWTKAVRPAFNFNP